MRFMEGISAEQMPWINSSITMGRVGVKELRDRSSAGAPPLWVLPSPCRVSVKKVQKFCRECMDNANFNETTSQHLS